MDSNQPMILDKRMLSISIARTSGDVMGWLNSDGIQTIFCYRAYLSTSAGYEEDSRW